MKALRILGISVAVLVVLLLAGIAVLYVLFDGEKIKREVVDVVQAKTQRQLDIVGPLELSVWPEVGIKVGKLTLSEPGGKTEFAALNAARISVAVMPLLSQRVAVRGIEVDGLKATLIKRKDGTLNIDDLTGAAAGKSDPAQADKGSAEKTDSVPAAPSTPIQLDIASVRITNASLNWRDEKSGTTTALSNLDLGSGRIQADSGQQTLKVEKLALTAKGKTGSDSFEVKLDVPKLDLSPTKSVGETLSLTAKLAGNARNLEAKLVLSGVEGNAQALKIGKLALDVDAKAGDSALKAKLESPVQANVGAQMLTLEKLAGTFELASPQIPMKSVKLPISGKLSADVGKQNAALELGTQFDESKIALKLKLAKFAPLALAFDLDINTLNLDKYMPPKAAEAKAHTGKTASTAKTATAAATEEKLDFSALKGLDVNGTVKIGSLQVSKLKIAQLNAKIKIAGGRLDVSPLSMNLYEGKAAGNLWLNANGNQLGVKQTLTGISINPLMQDLADKDLIEGRGNVALDIVSRGDTVTAIKKALAGSASLNLKDGAIKGINLAQTLRDIKSKLGGGQDATQQAKAGEKTDFSELSASLHIAKGVAHNEDLSMKSPFLRLAGAGDIDIGEGRMDYLAKTSVVSSSSGQGGKDLEHLKGLTIPVRITGPFDALSYKLELSDLAKDMAKAKLDEKKDELKSKAEDKLKSKLKGLFGR